jgi:glycosyltransferase involved in cell wall biosynthesis
LMLLTSPVGGLAHYCVHLWEPLSAHADPLYVTYRSTPVDDLVRGRIADIHPLMDPTDSGTIRDLVHLARQSGACYANLHSGTRTKLDFGYFAELLKALRAAGIRSVLHLHNVDAYRIGSQDLSAVSVLGGLADSILVGSRGEMETVRRALGPEPKPIALMHHGPYHLMDSGRLDPAEARQLLGLEADALVVLFFGYVREEKRLDDLFAAFQGVRRRLPRAILLVQSYVQYAPARRAWLAAQARQPGVRVNLGYAPLSEVEALFKAADVVALPYESVAASGVLNLARAFACPVVLTECFELAPYIHGTCGYAVSARDPKELADALIGILDLPVTQRQDLGRAWDGILEAESWANAAQVLWDACLAQPRRGAGSAEERPAILDAAAAGV